MTGTASAPREQPSNSRIPEGIRGAVVQPLTTSVKVKETQGFLCRISESHFEATTYNYVSKLRHAASWGEVGEGFVVTVFMPAPGTTQRAGQGRLPADLSCISSGTRNENPRIQ